MLEQVSKVPNSTPAEPPAATPAHAAPATTRPILTAPRGSNISVLLDLVRGLAAIGVMLSHGRNLFFEDYGGLENPSPLLKLAYFLTGFGHEMVMIFFVLSGFFIGSSVVRDLCRNRWSWTRYAVNRLTRLYIVLVPAVILTLVLDQAALHWLNSEIHHGNGGQICIPDVRPRDGAEVLLGNLAFLQEIAVPTFGSNTPLWSLGSEFWYYLLFPALLITLTPGARQRTLHLGFFLVAGWIALRWMPLFGVWLLGAALAFLPRSEWLSRPGLRRPLLAISILLTAGALTISRFHLANPLLADYLVGLTFTAVVLCVLHAPGECRFQTGRQLAEGLAQMSYSLYAIHLPLLAFLAAMLLSGRRWQPGITTIAAFLVIQLAAFAAAALFARLTEVRTDRVRRHVERLTGLA